MARRVNERNAALVAGFFRLMLHDVGADMLGNAARFFFRNFRFPEPIKNRRLSMINMTHHHHNRGTRFFDHFFFLGFFISHISLGRNSKIYYFALFPSASSSTFFSSPERAAREAPFRSEEHT